MRGVHISRFHFTFAVTLYITTDRVSYIFVGGCWSFVLTTICVYHVTSYVHLRFNSGFLGFLGFQDDEDDKGKVPPSVKRELLKAQRALRNDDYSTAEECYHQALFSLNSSELSETQAYIEARAVTLDKV